ncbi:MAG: SusC/RagA family TonB-linked outer membrane protein [Cytophagales bacterium]|nr:SusC/RagA family TonB-linked outer membrane protein [Cytophagales bacterium]
MAKRALTVLLVLAITFSVHAENPGADDVKQAMSVSQDEIIVKGKVVDQDGEPLPIVNVIIQGTQDGVTTDIDGNYEITVPSSETVLVFRYIGMLAKSIQVGNQTVINVTLEPDVSVLEDVVVTALGIERKVEALSYNVQEVSGEALLNNKDANFINALSGKVAGVNINSSSSGVGGASKVIMRGVKSISQSSNALYVIDGVPLYNFREEGSTEFGSSGGTESIADINPEDIENMTVLTGAAAAALYGSNGANGAIVITTKKGKEGVARLTISSSTEMMKAFVTPEFQNSYGTGDLVNNDAAPDKSWGKKLNETSRMGYDPVDDFLKTAAVYTNNMSYSAGGEKSQTYLSAGAVRSKGILPNNEYNRYNFTFRNTSDALNKKLRLDVGASYIVQDDRSMINQGVYSNPLVTAYLFPRGDDWNDIKMYERYDVTRKIYTQYWPQKIDEFVGQNPYWAAYRNTRENEKSRYMANMGLSYKVNDWLNFGNPSA